VPRGRSLERPPPPVSHPASRACYLPGDTNAIART
jgi:hypothetical protein